MQCNIHGCYRSKINHVIEITCNTLQNSTNNKMADKDGKQYFAEGYLSLIKTKKENMTCIPKVRAFTI